MPTTRSICDSAAGQRASHIPSTPSPRTSTVSVGSAAANSSSTAPPANNPALMTPRELAIATSAIANAICDGHLPNRLNLAIFTINMTAITPIGLIEANIVRQDLNGTRPLAAVEQLLIETWPEHFKKEPQRV